MSRYSYCPDCGRKKVISVPRSNGEGGIYCTRDACSFNAYTSDMAPENDKINVSRHSVDADRRTLSLLFRRPRHQPARGLDVQIGAVLDVRHASKPAQIIARQAPAAQRRPARSWRIPHDVAPAKKRSRCPGQARATRRTLRPDRVPAPV